MVDAETIKENRNSSPVEANQTDQMAVARRAAIRQLMLQ
jgi:hypothetical protein